MSMKTQGTELYFIDPDNGSVVEVGCFTSINAAGATRANFTVPPCLNDPTGVSEVQPGELTPGGFTFGINADPTDASHIRLSELLIGGEIIDFAFGWSDGFGVNPTANSSGFVLPATRTWYVSKGFVNGFPFDLASNAVVQTTVSIQETEPGQWVKKT